MYRFENKTKLWTELQNWIKKKYNSKKLRKFQKLGAASSSDSVRTENDFQFILNVLSRRNSVKVWHLILRKNTVTWISLSQIKRGSFVKEISLLKREKYFNNKKNRLHGNPINERDFRKRVVSTLQLSSFYRLKGSVSY